MQTKTYTNVELAGFRAELETSYRVTKKIAGGHEISFIDFEAYLGGPTSISQAEHRARHIPLHGADG
jgi:hypothetical protein